MFCDRNHEKNGRCETEYVYIFQPYLGAKALKLRNAKYTHIMAKWFHFRTKFNSVCTFSPVQWTWQFYSKTKTTTKIVYNIFTAVFISG